MSFGKFFGYFSGCIVIWSVIGTIFTILSLVGLGVAVERSNTKAAIDPESTEKHDDMEI